MNSKLNIIDHSATYLVRLIRHNNPNAASESVLFYALSLTINTLSSMVIALTASLITNHSQATIISIIGLLILRYFSGGLHLKSSVACCIFSACIIIFSSHVSFNFFNVGLVLTLCSFCIFLKTAPNGIEGISKIPKKYYPLLKITSGLIVLFNLYFQSSVLSAIFFIQAVLTTKFAYNILDFLEGKNLN
jgi:accessory gene regulator B